MQPLRATLLDAAARHDPLAACGVQAFDLVGAGEQGCEGGAQVCGFDQPGRLLSVRVGVKRSSAAQYYVDGQREVDSLLRKLVELRRDASYARRGA